MLLPNLQRPFFHPVHSNYTSPLGHLVRAWGLKKDLNSKKNQFIVDCKKINHASREANNTSNFGANAAKKLAALNASTSVDK